jgi:hypothetical protein
MPDANDENGVFRLYPVSKDIGALAEGDDEIAVNPSNLAALS